MKRRNNEVATSSSEYVEASSEQALAFLLFPRYEYTYESLQQFISIGSTFFRTFPKILRIEFIIEIVKTRETILKSCRYLTRCLLGSGETEKRNHP